MEFTDLLDVELVGDNLQAFENDWESVWEGMKELPTESVAEGLYKRQLEKWVQLKAKLELYEHEIAVHKNNLLQPPDKKPIIQLPMWDVFGSLFR